jgi:hypothetical protein
MPEQLTDRPATPTGWVAPALIQAAIAIVAFAVVGALAGVVWEWLWTPPNGVVVDHQWYVGLAALREEFSGTGLYVVVASVAGLVTGSLCGLFLDRAELVTLAAVVVGAALAGWVMVLVGHALGPPDPQELAETARDRTPLPGDLRVTGNSAYIAFPAGAVLGLGPVLLVLARRDSD